MIAAKEQIAKNLRQRTEKFYAYNTLQQTIVDQIIVDFCQWAEASGKSGSSPT